MDPQTPPEVSAPGGVAAGGDVSIAAAAGAVAAGVIGHLDVHLPAAPLPLRVRLVEAMPSAAVAFQPRQAVFASLGEALAAGERRLVVTAVAGGRGVGKTQVAAAFCQGCDAQGWPVVVWLPGQTLASIVEGLAGLADRVGCRPADGSTEDAARAAVSWLSAQPGPGVVVFDNAEDPDLIREWMPRAVGVRVLVTTTRRAFAGLGTVVDVGVYDGAEAVAYLRQRTGLDDDAGAGRVAEALGFLPVALAAAGAVIGGPRFPTFDAYLARVGSVEVAQVLRRPVGDPYPRGFAQAVTLAVDDLAAGDEGASVRRLLDLLALLSTNGVPLEFLPALADLVGAEPEAVVEWVEVLVDRSLASLSAGRDEVLVHRLVGRVLRELRAADGSLPELIKAAAGWLETLRPTGDEHQLAYRPVWRRLGSQVITLRANIPDTVDPDTLEPVQLLTFGLMYHLLEVGEARQAVEIGPAVVADTTRILGPDHPDTLQSRNNLANGYREVGRHAEAVALHERTLAERTRVLGPDHPDTLQSRNNLANGYWEVGRYAEAVTLIEQNLAERTRILGADHPDNLQSRNNLALGYWEVGRYAEAVTLLKRNLADCIRILGPDHPYTLASRNNLAEARRQRRGTEPSNTA